MHAERKTGRNFVGKRGRNRTDQIPYRLRFAVRIVVGSKGPRTFVGLVEYQRELHFLPGLTTLVLAAEIRCERAVGVVLEIKGDRSMDEIATDREFPIKRESEILAFRIERHLHGNDPEIVQHRRNLLWRRPKLR